MGVAGLWDIIRPAGVARSLTDLSVTDGFVANPAGLRGFRIGIDASIWFFHAEYGREGENPVLRTLFFRCATLMHSPFLPLFVFDGPKRPDFKRGKKINRTNHKLVPGMKSILESFGYEWRQAPGEAEAELAYLNRIGLIDGVLSDDVDNFLFGANTVIRNPSNNLSGNRANPVLNADGRDDKNHSRVFRLTDITAHPSIQLTRGGMILIGLMSGGDYHQGGVSRCGTVIAHGLAKCGFGDSLLQAATSMSRDALQTFLVNWRQELCHELRTNSQGHVGRKQVALANSVPSDFPDIDILLSYANPITSESLGRTENNAKLTWSKEPDLGKLAATCEFYFEWGYKEAIIKRFRTVIWHGAVLRILRHAALDLDRKCSSTKAPATPAKAGAIRPLPVGTPSKMITKHFSSLAISYDSDGSDNSDPGSDFDNPRLITKIHSERLHASTDKNVLEYRLEIAPAQLVFLAESGIKGTRSPDGPDEWASDNDDDDDEDGGKAKKGTKKPAPDPQSALRVWMPAVIVRLVEPTLVEQYEAGRREKQDKKAAGKARKAIKDGLKGSSRRAKAVLKTVSSTDRPTFGSETFAPNLEQPVKPLARSQTRTSLVEEEEESGSESDVFASKKTDKAISVTSKSKKSGEDKSSDSPSRPHIRDLTKKKVASSDLRGYFGAVKSSNNTSRKMSRPPIVSDRPPEPKHHTVVRDLTTKKDTLIGKSLEKDTTSSGAQQHRGLASVPPPPQSPPQRQLRKKEIAVLDYVSVSDTDEEPPAQMDPHASSYNSDDPFAITSQPLAQLSQRHSKQTHKQRSPSSRHLDYDEAPSYVHKSPRKSVEHTSPGSRRHESNRRPLSPVLTTSSQNVLELPFRKGSESIIEISDSEDETLGRVPTLQPLLLARARAQGKMISTTKHDKKNNANLIIDLT